MSAESFLDELFDRPITEGGILGDTLLEKGDQSKAPAKGPPAPPAPGAGFAEWMAFREAWEAYAEEAGG